MQFVVESIPAQASKDTGSIGCEWPIFHKREPGDFPEDGGHAYGRASEAIGSYYAAYRPRLSAPILEPVMRELRRLHGQIDGVVLVGTDQADEAHRHGDTLPAARVLVKLLKEKYSDVVKGNPKPRGYTGPPHNYAAACEAYRENILRDKALQTDHVYVVCTGGTPACNTGLLLAAIERFRERCTVMYVPRDAAIVELPPVGRHLLARFRLEAVRGLLEHRDFMAVAAMEGVPEHAKDVARSAAARLNLDFEAGYRLLTQALGRLESPPAELRDAQETGGLLADGDRVSVLREVYWHARLKWRRDECADFLGRVWRLQEAALYAWYKQVTGLDLDDMSNHSAFGKWVQQTGILFQHLERSLPSPVDLRPSTFLLQKAMEVLVKVDGLLGDDLRARGKTILEAVSCLEKARELRNKSVIAHGFKGLSKSAILNAMNTDEPGLLGQLEALMAAMGIDVGEDPYAGLATGIEKLAEQGR